MTVGLLLRGPHYTLEDSRLWTFCMIQIEVVLTVTEASNVLHLGRNDSKEELEMATASDMNWLRIE